MQPSLIRFFAVERILICFALLFCCNPVALFAQLTNQPTGNSQPEFHIVQSGNTLYSLARDNKVSVEDIRKWNNLNSNEILVGQKLIVGYLHP